MSSIFCGVISILIFMFAPNLIMLFSPENTEVIVEGAKYLSERTYLHWLFIIIMDLAQRIR